MAHSVAWVRPGWGVHPPVGPLIPAHAGNLRNGLIAGRLGILSRFTAPVSQFEAPGSPINLSEEVEDMPGPHELPKRSDKP
jgi:hypothetical protein